MAHTTLKSGHASLVDRLNRFPQGAPPSEVLFRILAMLFSEGPTRFLGAMSRERRFRLPPRTGRKRPTPGCAQR
jgi:hypothetical protein